MQIDTAAAIDLSKEKKQKADRFFPDSRDTICKQKCTDQTLPTLKYRLRSEIHISLLFL